MRDWKPQHYQAAGEAANIDPRVLEAALTAGKQVIAVNPALPPVFSLRHLSYLSGSAYKNLRVIVGREVDSYRTFRIRKRPRRGLTQSFRLICVPEPVLADVQRWILRNILICGQSHSASTAYRNRSTLYDAALPHCGSTWLVKLDVRRFFESVSEISVYKVFRRFGYQPLVAFELARLCTRVGSLSSIRRSRRWQNKQPINARKIRTYSAGTLGHLPQGASTSPHLSNLAMLEVDEELSIIAARFGMVYTRYADDLTYSSRSLDFSREKAAELIKAVYKILGRFGLYPNIAKTSVVPPRARKVVLGLLVDQPSPRLKKDFKMKMRMHLYYLEHPEVGPIQHAIARKFSSVAGLRNHLIGLAAYASQIEPSYGASLKERLAKIAWPLIY